MHPGLAELIRLSAAEPLAPACDHFYFLRHGQTEGNAKRIFQGVDIELSELGLEQATRAAERLAGEPIRSVVCSDARRAFDTAHTVAAGLGLTPLHFEGLRERNFGALIGTSSADLDWACEPEGGETLPQFVARKRAALAAALEHPAPVLIVAHGGSLHVLAAALHVPSDAAVLGNAQPLRFERDGGAWSVKPLLQQADGGGSALA
ncbi:histidine phosphatase family protein [Variovorax sp. KK3]|uniref:histidine phosphatase family protein n=1 Tax=Variovorax sp. KK3 TaxID=1855728 RepID=UPI00097C3008|nr:histidine phosphatase family protein [Variovorax sp. KK3]